MISFHKLSTIIRNYLKVIHKLCGNKYLSKLIKCVIIRMNEIKGDYLDEYI